jgi:uncharacterized protein HemY
MKIEEKWALGLAALSVLLLIVGVVLGKVLANAPGRVVRTVFPIAALVTLGCFAVFVLIARTNVKG